MAWKLWGGENPDEVLLKRYRLFLLAGVFLIAMFAVYRSLAGIEFLPNTEWIIPVLVVTGSFTLRCRRPKSVRITSRYFGVISLISVFVVWFVTYGFIPIHVFCWSGFIFIWLFSKKLKLSYFDRFSRILLKSTLATAIAIIIYDVWTGVVGHTLTTGAPLWLSIIGQVEFTLRHLTSLFFVPPIVWAGKLIIRIPVPARASVARSCSQTQGEGR